MTTQTRRWWQWRKPKRQFTAQDARLILEAAAIALYAMEPNYDVKTGRNIPWTALGLYARHYWRQRVINIPVADYDPDAKDGDEV